MFALCWNTTKFHCNNWLKYSPQFSIFFFFSFSHRFLLADSQSWIHSLVKYAQMIFEKNTFSWNFLCYFRCAKFGWIDQQKSNVISQAASTPTVNTILRYMKRRASPAVCSLRYTDTILIVFQQTILIIQFNVAFAKNVSP